MKIRQFTEDQIIHLLQDGKKGERPIEDLCRDPVCSPASYDIWKKKDGDTNVDEARRLLGQNSTRVGLGRFVGSKKKTLVSCGLSASSTWRSTR